jgi:hypothetical protein
MVDAAIEKGFAITMPNGHVFTPPPKQLEAHIEPDTLLDTSPTHQRPVFVSNVSSGEEKIKRVDGAMPSYSCKCGFIVAVGETECMHCHTRRR